jgi:hypothetical protein
MTPSTYDLSYLVDADALRYRFALLTRPDERRAFLHEVNRNPRLLELWSAPSPSADTSEHLASLECAHVQRLFREVTGTPTDEDYHYQVERRTGPNHSVAALLPFSLV